MWPVTSEMMISVKPPTPIRCPNGATRAVTRLTRARELVWRPLMAIDEGPPAIGTAVEGAICCPTICVGGA